MAIDVGREVAALNRLTAGQLRERYAAAFGEATAAHNKTWLVRRIAWRLQSAAGGGLSERARARAAEMAGESDLRVTAPAAGAAAGPAAAGGPTRAGVVPRAADPRLPRPGTVLTRAYKGKDVRVEVRADGFAHAGTLYPSLSAVAKAVSGSHCNGFAFFRPPGKEPRRETTSTERHRGVTEGGPVRRVHAEEHRGRAGAGVQLARRPAGGRRRLRPQPGRRGVGAAAGYGPTVAHVFGLRTAIYW